MVGWAGVAVICSFYTKTVYPGSIVAHIRPKRFTDKQMSRIEYNYYVNNVSKTMTTLSGTE
jgi:hypothetical protein